MEAANFVLSNKLRILSLILVLGYFLGVLNIHFSDKNNFCTMTYMYEYPQFVRITMPENKDYPQYGLYAYSEGRLTERARKMWFDGIPVLFLPGNSGSYMQARSLASVALRKSLSKGYDFHFDFFTMSTNEELSGLYGGVLLSQTKFAAESISKILSLYKSNEFTKSVPTSVILIGHSMGGVIAKRLLAYPYTVNMTNIALTLAAPLEAPVVTTDNHMKNYYTCMEEEWQIFVNENEEIKNRKLLISFGNGPRDVLVPSGLTSSNESYISALTTAIPGVWVSPDHVGIVWCKQLVMAINRYLFSIVDPVVEQISADQTLLKARARQYFQANRSMTLDPNIRRANATMIPDAFWYEDNRRIYQVSRPEIDKTTYLMIRLVKFPQNRFVAVEAINVDDKEWIYGCNAKFTYHMHRYCKDATTLTELSRWTPAAIDFGRRKLATVNLHSLMQIHPDWTHVIVKVSPTRKPITLNVDVNDHASRQIRVKVPPDYSYSIIPIIAETEADALYYEIILEGFNVLHQAYLLHVEPTETCKAASYHVSAEFHVPWAKNNEYYHYFTHLKRKPMKLRLFKSNPNVSLGHDIKEYVKITMLLDPQCTFTISISQSWYHRLAQFVRNYTPVLVPYVAATVLLAARNSMLSHSDTGFWPSIHTALMGQCGRPYFAFLFSRMAIFILTSIPTLSYLFETPSWRNLELQLLTKSLLMWVAWITALGFVNLAVAGLLVVMVFSSQVAHRLLFRIIWRGGTKMAENIAIGMQKVPIIVTFGLLSAVPFASGASGLAVGAAFYFFLLSKMYEEYLEDYFYKIMAKVASKACRFFKKSKPKPISRRPDKNAAGEDIQWHNLDEMEQECFLKEGEDNKRSSEDSLSSLNFHMTLFLMWLCVTIVNVPVLLTWARNYKYNKTLLNSTQDTSFLAGVVMSTCSFYVWRMDGPRKNLKYTSSVGYIILMASIFILALGPFCLNIVTYGVTISFFAMTIQQVLDEEIVTGADVPNNDTPQNDNATETESQPIAETSTASSDNKNEDKKSTEKNAQNDCECNENVIYNRFKNFRDKIDLTNDNE